MRVFTIKHKGAAIWQNLSIDREIEFSDGDKIIIGVLFYRKKDAEKYLGTKSYKECYEVVGATIDKSSQDNRKKRNYDTRNKSINRRKEKTFEAGNES